MPSQRFATTKLLPHQAGKLGILTLNNAKASHALTLDMILSAQEMLQHWWHNPDISALLLQSSSTDDDATATTTNHNQNQTAPPPPPTKRRPPSFCAGGDIKALALACRAEQQPQHKDKAGDSAATTTTPPLSSEFFRQEYYLNYALHLWSCVNKKPQISVWNGVVMGGGVGLSLFGSYRIATEHALWAMPETAIGLFPDVGSMWALPRVMMKQKQPQPQQEPQPQPTAIIPYLLLTGHRLRPDDLLYTGLATHYVPSQDLPELQAALIQATTTSNSTKHHEPATPEEAQAFQPQTTKTTTNNNSTATTTTVDPLIAPVLDSFHRPLPTEKCFLAQHAQELQQVFGGGGETTTTDDDDHQDPSLPIPPPPQSLLQVVERLQALPSDSVLARSALASLAQASPTSLILTWELWQRRQQRQNFDETLAEHLALDYHVSQQLMQRSDSDFYEGVRAALLDRSKPPQWHYASWTDALAHETELVTTNYLDSFDAEHPAWKVSDSTILKFVNDDKLE
ncbi:hypothetical protein ACA910_019378 [Epithemia clementina (nom. ined.)]